MVCLSIIVPVYNLEEYIEECLNSIISQLNENIELIVIDDGSTDNTFNIINLMIGTFSNCMVVRQANAGLGAARNIGLRIATGRYILMIDGDDFIESNALQILLLEMEKCKLDVCIYNALAFTEYKSVRKLASKKYFNFSKNDTSIISGLEFIKLTGGKAHSVPLKMYRKDFILENNLFFIESIRGEDVDFFYRVFIKAVRVKYIDYIGYFRRYRIDSIMTSSASDNLLDRLNNFYKLEMLLEEVQSTDRLLLKKQFVYYAIVLWIMICCRPKSEIYECLKIFEDKGILRFIKNNACSMLVKFFYILMQIPVLDIKIFICKSIKKIFKHKVRLLQF